MGTWDKDNLMPHHATQGIPAVSPFISLAWIDQSFWTNMELNEAGNWLWVQETVLNVLAQKTFERNIFLDSFLETLWIEVFVLLEQVFVRSHEFEGLESSADCSKANKSCSPRKEKPVPINSSSTMTRTSLFTIDSSDTLVPAKLKPNRGGNPREGIISAERWAGQNLCRKFFQDIWFHEKQRFLLGRYQFQPNTSVASFFSCRRCEHSHFHLAFIWNVVLSQLVITGVWGGVSTVICDQWGEEPATWGGCCTYSLSSFFQKWLDSCTWIFGVNQPKSCMWTLGGNQLEGCTWMFDGN